MTNTNGPAIGEQVHAYLAYNCDVIRLSPNNLQHKSFTGVALGEDDTHAYLREGAVPSATSEGRREPVGRRKRREQESADYIPLQKCVGPPLEAVEAILPERCLSGARRPRLKGLGGLEAEDGRSR